MTSYKICYSAKHANKAGKRIQHPDTYFQKVMLRTGSYAKAVGVMLRDYRIKFWLEPVEKDQSC